MKPLWNGFMKASHDGPRGSNTVIHCNPMIQKPSSDYYSIYLTMSFVSDVARKCGYDPVLTFDQPLYWKAMEITTNKQQKIVHMPGTFHTCISFYGSIGYIMVGSGSQSLLEIMMLSYWS